MDNGYYVCNINDKFLYYEIDKLIKVKFSAFNVIECL